MLVAAEGGLRTRVIALLAGRPTNSNRWTTTSSRTRHSRRRYKRNSTERGRHVDAPTAGPEHPLDEILDHAGLRHSRGKLGPPARATKTRPGSFTQISSTVGSSRYGCNGPNPSGPAVSSLVVCALWRTATPDTSSPIHSRDRSPAAQSRNVAGTGRGRASRQGCPTTDVSDDRHATHRRRTSTSTTGVTLQRAGLPRQLSWLGPSPVARSGYVLDLVLADAVRRITDGHDPGMCSCRDTATGGVRLGRWWWRLPRWRCSRGGVAVRPALTAPLLPRLTRSLPTPRRSRRRRCRCGRCRRRSRT